MGIANFLSHGSFTIRVRGGGSFHVLAPLVTYLVGGTLAGALVGLLLPLMQWKIGAAVVGAIVAVPLCGSVLLLTNGSVPWSFGETVTLAIASLALGIPGGTILRVFLDERHFHRQGRRGKESRSR